jgi:hypothetical protein
MNNKNYERKVNLIIIENRLRQYSLLFVKLLLSVVCDAVKVLRHNIWIFGIITERFVDLLN